MSKVSLKFKCKNFDALKNKIKINNKDVVLEPYKLFNRIAVVSQGNVTVSESLGYALTILPTSLFSEEQFMRKAAKGKLGKHLKDKVHAAHTCNAATLLIDGGWLIHQIPWASDKNFSAIGDSYVDFVKNKSRGRATVVVFDG